MLSARLGISILFVCLLWIGPVAASDDVRTLQVVGYGHVAAAPNQLTIRFQVQHDGKSAAAVLKKHRVTLANIMQQIHRFQPDKRYVQTQQVTITPRYNYVDRQREFAGYQASTSIVVETEKLTEFGGFLDQVIQHDATSLSGIAFEHSQAQALREKAKRLAVLNARDQATLMAKTLDIRLGRILAIRDTPTSAPSPRFSASSSALSATPELRLAPGSTSYLADVTVVFEIH